MNATDLQPSPANDWRPKVLLIGAIVGALVGVGAAHLYSNTVESKGRHPEFTAGDGVKLGVLLLGLMRSVATIGEGN